MLYIPWRRMVHLPYRADTVNRGANLMIDFTVRMDAIGSSATVTIRHASTRYLSHVACDSSKISIRSQRLEPSSRTRVRSFTEALKFSTQVVRQ